MADTFTDFVQNLFPSLGQVQQPMLTSPFTDPSAYRMSPEAAAYYADPFRKQNTIQQASLDAALKKKQADEAAQRLSGMLSGGGDGGMDMGLNPAVEAFLDAETDAERGARISQLSNFLNPFNTTPINYGTLLGLNSKTGMAAQNAITGGKISGLVSSLFGLPSTSYGGAEGIAAENLGSLGINDGVTSIGGVSLGGVDTSGGFDAGGMDSGGGSFGGMAGNTGSADAPW